MGRKSFINEESGPLQAQFDRDRERSKKREAAPLKVAPVAEAAPVVRKPPVERSPAPVRPRPVAPAPKSAPRHDPVDQASPRVKVSREALQDLEDALEIFHRATGSKIHMGIATRALWALLVHAQGNILEELRRSPIGRLPSTRDPVAYAAYEDNLMKVLVAAVRKLPRSAFRTEVGEAGEAEG